MTVIFLFAFVLIVWWDISGEVIAMFNEMFGANMNGYGVFITCFITILILDGIFAKGSD